MPIDMIPPQYDVAPAIAVVERVMSFDEVQKVCPGVTGRVLLPRQYWNGCGKIVKNVCYVWRVDNDETRRHEIAHCNGWGPDHGG